MTRIRPGLIWLALLLLLAVPIIAAAQSPLLAFRQPIYITAGLAGIAGLALLLLQPLLIGGALPGLSLGTARHLHRWVGIGLVTAILTHVIGLWITSPPDVIDALLFRSPTPFSVWGVIAMWAAFAAAALAALRRRLRLRPLTWRRAHLSLAVLVVFGTVVHALQIEGTMETISKAVLCLAVVAATGWLTLKLRKRARSPS